MLLLGKEIEVNQEKDMLDNPNSCYLVDMGHQKLPVILTLVISCGYAQLTTI